MDVLGVMAPSGGPLIFLEYHETVRRFAALGAIPRCDVSCVSYRVSVATFMRSSVGRTSPWSTLNPTVRPRASSQKCCPSKPMLVFNQAPSRAGHHGQHKKNGNNIRDAPATIHMGGLRNATSEHDAMSATRPPLDTGGNQPSGKLRAAVPCQEHPGQRLLAAMLPHRLPISSSHMFRISPRGRNMQGDFHGNTAPDKIPYYSVAKRREHLQQAMVLAHA